MTLPFADAATPLTASRRRSAADADGGAIAASLEGLRVLVVDDEADACAATAAVLEQAGAVVTIAASVVEALAALDATTPDVIVSDIAMPFETGYELIARAAEHASRRGADIRGVALTAHAGAEGRERALAAGYEAYVTKPVEPAELIAVVAKVVGRSSSA